MASDKFYKIKIEDIERVSRLTIEKERLKADRTSDHKDDIDKIETEISRVLRPYHLRGEMREVLRFIETERREAVAESDRDVSDSGDEGKRWTDDQIAKRIQLKYIGRQRVFSDGVAHTVDSLAKQLEKEGISPRVIEQIQRGISIEELKAFAKNNPEILRRMTTLRDARVKDAEIEEIVIGNEEALGFDYGEDEPDRPDLKPTKPSILSRMRAGLRDAAYRFTDRIPFVKKRRELAAAQERQDEGLEEISDIRDDMEAAGISKDDIKALINEYEIQMSRYMQLEEGDPNEPQAKIDEITKKLEESGIDKATIEAFKVKLLNAVIKITSSKAYTRRITEPQKAKAEESKTVDDNEEAKKILEAKKTEIETARKELEAKGINLETLDKYVEVRAKKSKLTDKESEEYKALDGELKTLYSELMKGISEGDAKDVKHAIMQFLVLQKEVERLEKGIEKETGESQGETEWNESPEKPDKKKKKNSEIDYNGVSSKQKQELDNFFEANKQMMLSEAELKLDNVNAEYRRYGTMEKDGKKVPFMYFSFDSQQASPDNPADKRNVVVTFIVTTDGIKRLTALPSKNRDVSHTELNDSSVNPADMTQDDGEPLYSFDDSITTEGTDLVEMEYLKKSDAGNYSYMRTTETGTMTVNMGTKPLASRKAVENLNDYAEKRKKEVLDGLSKDVLSDEALKKYLESNGIDPKEFKSDEYITSGTGTYTRNSADNGFKDLKFLAFTYNKNHPEQGPVAIDISSGLEGSVSHRRFIKCKGGYIDPETVKFDKDGKPSPIIPLTDIIKEARKMELNASFMDRVMRQQTERKPLISTEDRKIARISEAYKGKSTKEKDERGDDGREDAE
mgnify:CR=1 FL=1